MLMTEGNILAGLKLGNLLPSPHTGQTYISNHVVARERSLLNDTFVGPAPPHIKTFAIKHFMR
jgi:hypothetical protein